MSALPPKADIGTTGIYEYGSCHKAHNFFGTKSEKGRPRFFARGPRDVRDGRWSETLSRFANAGPRDVRDGRWSEGTRMVAVDVAIAHRGPRDVADGDDTRIVARLLRTDFDHAARRAHLFADCAMFAKKVVLTKRMRWFEDSNGSPSV